MVLSFVTRRAIYTSFCGVNVLLHTLGTYLLVCVFRRKRHRTVHNLLVINLAIVEGICNAMVIFTTYVFKEGSRTFVYFDTVYGTPLDEMYSLTMIYITADRLLVTLLDIRYNVYCTVARTKLLLLWSWIIVISLCVIVTLILHFTSWLKDNSILWRIIDQYLPTFLIVLFLIFAIASYSTMFFKLIKSRARSNGSSARYRKKSTGYQIFIEFRFYVSTLLISSCLTLTVIPRLMDLCLDLYDEKTALL